LFKLIIKYVFLLPVPNLALARSSSKIEFQQGVVVFSFLLF